MPSCCREASARPTERCCAISASSQSQTVVPSATLPGLVSTPEATSRASTSVVLPPPDGPTSTTLRMAAGLSAVGAAPAPAEVVVLSAMTFPPGGSSLAAAACVKPQFPEPTPSTSDSMTFGGRRGGDASATCQVIDTPPLRREGGSHDHIRRTRTALHRHLE